MGRLNTADVELLRAKADPLSTQVAAFTAAEFYKSPHAKSKPSAMSHKQHFSIESKNFTGSTLKKTANQPIKRRFIPLGTGRPNADFYPWELLTLRGGSTYPNTPHYASGREIDRPHDTAIVKHGGPYDLARGLNYGHAVGSQPLVRYITEHMEIVHDPPYRDWGVILTCGSTAALDVAMRIFCNRGDTILTEKFTYPGMIEVAQLLGLHTLGIEMDAGGLLPERLEDVLRDWDASQGTRPTVLYTIPSGQNPTGTTQSLQRKTKIYEVVQNYDLMVIEDDPYYFLRMDLDSSALENGTTDSNPDKTAAYLASLAQSYLTLDRDGRVLRLDSVSKILAPGLRAGWVTASEEIIAKFIAYQEVSTVAVSGPTQLMLWNLLDVTWGHVGFFTWLIHLSTEYRSRLDVLLQACDTHLPTSVCSWVPPDSGMFLWISLDLQRHPSVQSMAQREAAERANLATKTQIREIEVRLYATALERGVQITTGSLFDSNKLSAGSLHLRLTYAAAAQGDFDEAIKILGQMIREEFTMSE
jgi:aromatic amino acid aminotransferase I